MVEGREKRGVVGSARTFGFVRLGLTAGAALALAACGGGSMLGGGGSKTQGGDPDLSFNAPVGKVTSQPLGGSAAAGGNTIGTGATKIALILPLTGGNGQASLVGQSLRNAADLALSESGEKDLTILVKDDHSSPDGARDAAQAGDQRTGPNW